MKFSPIRDTLSAALGVAPMYVGLPPFGLIGTAAKKAFIKENDSFVKKALIGIAAMIASGGAGLIPYIVAAPGQEVQKDVQACRTQVANDRYSQKI
ncbi:MAG: hypothetical protein VYC39_12585 [Myxococcota bacterium]|nr:hypothetical protein [Myxococcota bacterium]